MNRSSASNLFDQLPHGFRMDRRLGPVYDRAPASADDLCLVRGIETREAVILNRLGVYFLPQIALWELHESAAFAEELGRSHAALADEQWIEQAQNLCRPRPAGPSNHSAHLPASVVRTVSLLACALLIGCLLVYGLNLRSNRPLRGVLSADITSLRVPADCTLMTAHIQAGDEVFSGTPLLTLEKTEHLAMISGQEQRVRELERQLQQAEAQASLDLAWRTRELDRELSDVRTRAHLIQEVKRTENEPYRSAASLTSPYSAGTIDGVSARVVSTPRFYPPERPSGQPNRMVFISGASGESSLDCLPPAPLPVKTAATSQPLLLTSETKADGLLAAEAQNVELRLHRLENLREALPQQVRTAAGVDSVRIRFEEASQQLADMKTSSREVSVLCPSHGRVGQIRYQAGDTMAAGEVMLKILHTDRRYVVLNVPTERVNEIQPGAEVRLIFPGNDQYTGRVSNLPMLADASLPGRASLVTVRVEPTGRLWPELPIGSQIEVHVGSLSGQ